MTTHSQQIADIAKAAPPLTVSGMTVAGFPLSDWVLLFTAIYTVLQIVLIVRRTVAARRFGDPACAEDCPIGKRYLNNQRDRLP